jgi:regulation of enolase protein 1 (concanavalin A-like superfamily)
MDQSGRRVRRWDTIPQAPRHRFLMGSSVVSNPFSDWAMQPYPVDGPLTLRMTAAQGPHQKIHIPYKNGAKWIPFREVTGWVFGKEEDMEVGIMTCSPGDSGVRVEFWDIVANDYTSILAE